MGDCLDCYYYKKITIEEKPNFIACKLLCKTVQPYQQRNQT